MRGGEEGLHLTRFFHTGICFKARIKHFNWENSLTDPIVKEKHQFTYCNCNTWNEDAWKWKNSLYDKHVAKELLLGREDNTKVCNILHSNWNVMNPRLNSLHGNYISLIKLVNNNRRIVANTMFVPCLPVWQPLLMGPSGPKIKHINQTPYAAPSVLPFRQR